MGQLKRSVYSRVGPNRHPQWITNFYMGLSQMMLPPPILNDRGTVSFGGTAFTDPPDVFMSSNVLQLDPETQLSHPSTPAPVHAVSQLPQHCDVYGMSLIWLAQGRYFIGGCTGYHFLLPAC